MKRFLLVLFSLIFLVFVFAPSSPVFAQNYTTCPDSGNLNSPSCPSSHPFCDYEPGVGRPICQTTAGERYVAPTPFSSSWTSECTTGPNGEEIATLQGFGCIFRNILNLVVPLLGIALFVLLIAGGFQYMTAGGDPKQTQKASGIITTAIIGIAVVIGVWFIFRILSALTGLNLLNFVIPG